ncbi:MAG TPA: cytochrome c-type biogenesis protein CcmH [Gaiellaceae bacterium]|nr:cytochrome c-type biogenesis protein CcmH [Gaiellaceae bacterium]
MRRLALAAAVLGLALAAPAAASEERPTPAELESELVCPVCESTLDTSNAPVAQRMKVVIRQRIAEGATKSEIKAEFVEQFGPRVLATPPRSGFDLLAWVLPVAGGAVGVAAVVGLSIAWSRRRGGAGDGDGRAEPEEEPLDADLERRLDAELARFE